MVIKPIETVYNGYRFRSRLEARYAVFFDTLGVKYEYEKEGYLLDRSLHPSHSYFANRKGTVTYLPDFWLPEHDCFVEIKGEEITDDEREKAILLAYTLEKNVYIFVGNISVPDWDIEPKDEVFFGDGGMDYDHVWCECSFCGMIGIQYCGYADRLVCKHEGPGRVSNYSTPRLIAAYTAARQARFEHGETPHV